MSNAQWHEDQAIGERALREDAKWRGDIREERKRIARYLRRVARVSGHLIPLDHSHVLALLADAIERGDHEDCP